jgi:alpha-beta hydrolase superfamily lysophospholipase
VLVHGLGATHTMKLSQYEQAFAARGIVALAFDFRHLGASDGTPRQVISLRRQLADIDAALGFLAADPGVDTHRIGLWAGTASPQFAGQLIEQPGKPRTPPRRPG